MVFSWLAPNPRARRDLKFGRAQRFVINPAGIPELCEELKECPRHQPTPLYALANLAERLGLGEIRVKDESQRFGFGAFKALGGVIAVYDALAGAIREAAIMAARSPPAPSSSAPAASCSCQNSRRPKRKRRSGLAAPR